MPPSTDSTARMDAHVVEAWHSRELTDGTSLDLGRTDREQGFVVREDGTYPVDISRSGIQRCDDGSERLANVINVGAIRPNAGGHTHPRGRDGDVSGLPGPEDGVMARVTSQPAYVISSRGAFAIEHGPEGFTIRQLAGTPLSSVEKGEMSRLIDAWNQHGGGSGARCTFTPN